MHRRPDLCRCGIPVGSFGLGRPNLLGRVVRGRGADRFGIRYKRCQLPGVCRVQWPGVSRRRWLISAGSHTTNRGIRHGCNNFGFCRRQHPGVRLQGEALCRRSRAHESRAVNRDNRRRAERDQISGFSVVATHARGQRGRRAEFVPREYADTVRIAANGVWAAYGCVFSSGCEYPL